MNQEEWLAERRRLGLPADPTKDFPPNYRESPDAIQNRFARPGGRQGQARATPSPSPTQGTTSGGGSAAYPASQRPSSAAPGSGRGAASTPPSSQDLLNEQRARLAAAARSVAHRPAQAAQSAQTAQRSTPRPAPARPGYPTPSGAGSARPAGVRLPAGTTVKKKSSPLGTVIGILVVGGLAIAGPLNEAFKDVPGISPPVTLWDGSDDDGYVSDVDIADIAAEDPALAERVRALTKGLVAGDPAAIKALAQSKSADLSTLTPASAAAAMGADASFELTGFSIGDTAATVEGELSTSDRLVSLTLGFTRSSASAAWVPLKVDFPVLQPQSLPTAASKINGVPVNASKLKAAGKPVAVWPGTVSVELAKDRYTTWEENPVIVPVTADLLPHAAQETVSFYAEGTRTAAFKKDAIAAAEANYQRCLKLTDLTLKNCPFGVHAEGITQPRNIKYTQTKAPSGFTVVGSVGSERVFSESGQVSLSGRGVYRGQSTTLEGKLSVNFNGSVSVKDGKIVYSED
ncbi:hypothetical protein [Galactobacter valiniphilus]|uniref:hypothetical protein n=1 Tax=Galactobacter valiniphilus TaxID=2676122 RepID=UPI003735E8AD